MSSGGDWAWTDSLVGSPPGDFDPAFSYQDWGDGLDASSSYESVGASCLEITPYLPKMWNPFSCEVHTAVRPYPVCARLAFVASGAFRLQVFAGGVCFGLEGF